MIYNDFETKARPVWLAADTETYTYIDNVLVSEEELNNLGKRHNLAWFRQHARVKVYAWLLSDGKHFAFLETFNEFVEFMCKHKIKAVWWYNAKFDFAQIDWQLLSGESGEIWQISGNSEDEGKDENNSKNATFISLHGDKGQRYSLKLWHEYKGRGRKEDRHKHVHSFTNYDFCNIFGGGLKANLEAFNVVDFDGNPVRKLEMDYQQNTSADGTYTEDALAYMKVDVVGLYHLIRIADEFCDKHFKIHLAGKKPAVMTAGGLAKMQLLKALYKYDNSKLNKVKFNSEYYMTLDLDKYFRDTKLYEGGICLVNERYQNKLIEAPFYRYDVNSMYPAQMDKMPALKGKPLVLTPAEYAKFKNKQDYEVIIELTSYQALMNDKMMPFMRDYNTGDFAKNIYFNSEELGFKKCFFMREFELYQKIYDIAFTASKYILYKKLVDKGYTNFVQTYYKMKAQAKAEHNAPMKMFAKLLLNSAYGKLAERAAREKTHREYDEENNAIRLVHDGEEVDANSLLSVVQGALVSCMGRCTLIQYSLDICKGDLAKNFIYCDTDSVHTFTLYDKCDDYELGAMKLEAACKAGKWLAPKTYFEIGIDDVEELHTKGLPIKTIYKYAKENNIKINAKGLDSLFKAGAKYQALSGINITGGKALIPIDKELCKVSNTLELVLSNIGGEQELNEV